jgi:hypothetical protein
MPAALDKSLCLSKSALKITKVYKDGMFPIAPVLSRADDQVPIQIVDDSIKAETPINEACAEAVLTRLFLTVDRYCVASKSSSGIVSTRSVFLLARIQLRNSPLTGHIFSCEKALH